jgi:hypothetical protein
MTTPHYLTISDHADGRQRIGWPHPADCPDGKEECDIYRRTEHIGLQGMADFCQGLTAGRYLIVCSGDDSLALVDEQGQVLPNVPIRVEPYSDSDPTPSADQVLAVAAYEVIREVLDGIAELVVEDSEMALSLFEEIRMAQITDDELRAVRPRNILFNSYVGAPAAYTKPIARLLELLGVPVPAPDATPASKTPD